MSEDKPERTGSRPKKQPAPSKFRAAPRLESGEKFTKPRRVDEDIVTYLKGLQPVLDRLVGPHSFEDRETDGSYHARYRNSHQAHVQQPTFEEGDDADEERQQVVTTVMEELKFRTASVLCEKRTCGLMEQVCLSASRQPLALATLLQRMVPYACFLATNRYSSHVLQTLLGCMSQAVIEGIVDFDSEVHDAYANAEEEGEEGQSSGTPSGLTFVSCLVAFNNMLRPHLTDLILDPSASHVLRSLLCILLSLPIIADRKGKNSKHKHATLLAKPLDDCLTSSDPRLLIDAKRIRNGRDESTLSAVLTEQAFEMLQVVSSSSDEIFKSIITDFNGSSYLSLLYRLAVSDDVFPAALTYSMSKSSKACAADILTKVLGVTDEGLVSDSEGDVSGDDAKLLAAAQSSPFYALSGEAAGSAFIETVIECCPRSTFAVICVRLIRMMMMEYAADRCANHVLQAVLKRLAREGSALAVQTSELMKEKKAVKEQLASSSMSKSEKKEKKERLKKVTSRLASLSAFHQACTGTLESLLREITTFVPSSAPSSSSPTMTAGVEVLLSRERGGVVTRMIEAFAAWQSSPSSSDKSMLAKLVHVIVLAAVNLSSSSTSKSAEDEADDKTESKKSKRDLRKVTDTDYATALTYFIQPKRLFSPAPSAGPGGASRPPGAGGYDDSSLDPVGSRIVGTLLALIAPQYQCHPHQDEEQEEEEEAVDGVASKKTEVGGRGFDSKVMKMYKKVSLAITRLPMKLLRALCTSGLGSVVVMDALLDTHHSSSSSEGETAEQVSNDMNDEQEDEDENGEEGTDGIVAHRSVVRSALLTRLTTSDASASAGAASSTSSSTSGIFIDLVCDRIAHNIIRRLYSQSNLQLKEVMVRHITGATLPAAIAAAKHSSSSSSTAVTSSGPAAALRSRIAQSRYGIALLRHMTAEAYVRGGEAEWSSKLKKSKKAIDLMAELDAELEVVKKEKKDGKLSLTPSSSSSSSSAAESAASAAARALLAADVDEEEQDDEEEEKRSKKSKSKKRRHEEEQEDEGVQQVVEEPKKKHQKKAVKESEEQSSSHHRPFEIRPSRPDKANMHVVRSLAEKEGLLSKREMAAQVARLEAERKMKR